MQSSNTTRSRSRSSPSSTRRNSPRSVDMRSYVESPVSITPSFSPLVRSPTEERYVPKRLINLRNAIISYYEKDDQSNGDINTWDVSNITDMKSLFEGVTADYIDLKGWNVSKVENMTKMFHKCKANGIDLSGWDVKEVKDMSDMFSECSMQTLKIRDWNTRLVYSMSYMFHNCINLTALNMMKFNLYEMRYMDHMFYGCKKLIKLNLEELRFGSKIRFLMSMFQDCESLEKLNISRWNVSEVTNMSSMFDGCKKLHNIRLNTWKTTNLRLCMWMFRDCYLFNSPLSRWDTSKVESMKYMFENCRSFNQSLVRWKTPILEDTTGMFDGCVSLEFSNSNLRSVSATVPVRRQNTALPFEIHNYFENIDIPRLLEKIGYKKAYKPLQISTNTDIYKIIQADLIEFLEKMVKLVNDENTTTQFDRLVNSKKFTDMFELYYHTPINKGSTIMAGDIIESVKAYVRNLKDDKFKINYIKSYLEENLKAYKEDLTNPQACISCSKGIMERLVTKLPEGGLDNPKEEYFEIARIIEGATPKKISEYGSACLGEHKSKLKNLKTLRKRKFYLKRCIMNKLLEEGVVSDVHSEPEFLSSEFMNNTDEFLTDDNFQGGGRGKKMTKRRR
jgi:surface protein